ncbi:unnamed protein product [Orchesella dallaii]|uniref:Hepatocyte growth factor-regulated tyrosine kinase substrate n=1 Tax=Orchesella dallaii TaxID=48710 RepID=A0ABP1RER9_9HEXA
MATIFKSTGHAQFDKLLEKATSNLLLEPEWASIIQICDLIRQKDCQPKYAMGQIKKKIQAPNPHVGFYGLQVLESVVKNCGSPIHEEIATKTFMEELMKLAKTSQHDNIREKVLELIQCWAHAFRKIPSYRAVQDVLNIMKAEGAKFPPLVEADAMFVADQAPEWADGECCHRCRVEFSFTQRKHHCRACGQIFCNKCSGKECTLPRFGIEKEVRVCDACYEKYGKEGVGGERTSSSSSSFDDHRVNGGGNSGVAAGPKVSAPPGATPNPDKTKELELAEEEQLQLALAISQSEAEAKEQEMKKRTKVYNLEPATITSPVVQQPPKEVDPDPELSRYLNRSYWENKSANSTAPEKSFVPSAPFKSANVSVAPQTQVSIAPEPILTPEDKTIDMFVENLRSQIEMFVNRMKSNSSRGRPIANDTSVQSLFMSITHMHSQLLAYIQVQDNARGRYELLQDKLNQVRDARAALDDLRNEHAEAIRRQQEEQERVRAYQMAQKLALMRQKKNEYLQYQRQLAMQRMQEQEREMQLRIAQEQAKVFANVPVGQPWGVMPQQGYPGMQQQPPQGPPPQHYGQWGPPNQQVMNSPTGGNMMYGGMHEQQDMSQQMQGGHNQMQGPQQQMGPPPQQQQQQQMGPPPGQPQQQQMGPPPGQPQQQQMGPPPGQPQQQQMGPPPQQQQQQQQMAPQQQMSQGPQPGMQAAPQQMPPPQQQQQPMPQQPQQMQEHAAPPPAVAELISFD